MSQIKRYTWRDDFNGNCEYVEVICAEISVVFPDGRRVICNHLNLSDVDHAVDMGWWVEIKDWHGFPRKGAVAGQDVPGLPPTG